MRKTNRRRHPRPQRSGKRPAPARRWQWWQIVVLGVGLAGVAVAAGFQIADARRQPLRELGNPRQFTVADRSHVTGPVRYPQTPPVGGPHDATWQNCGAYTQPVRNENAVHSMEHGAVWITYQPTLPADQVAQLDRLARQQTYVLVSPYPGLPAPIVASAWGEQASFTRAGDSRLRTFVRGFRQGAYAPEPGAPCTNGTGSPA